MDDSIDPVEVLQAILDNIVGNTDSKEELIKLWFYVGRMMGIEKIFPEMQVVVTPDENGENQPIILIGTLHALVVEYMTSQNVVSEDIAHICLREIEKLTEDEVIH